EIGEPPVDARGGADVGLLLRRQRLGLGAGKMGERDGRPVEMRLDEFRRLRDADMGMDVDGHAPRPQLAPRLAVAARRGAFVFIPLLGHETMSLLKWR